MLEIPKSYYVYMYLNPAMPGKYFYPELNKSFGYEPIYVGKGSGSRKTYHVMQARNMIKHNNPKRESDIIEFTKTLLLQGLEPIILVLHTDLTEEKAFELEKLYISSIKRKKEGGSLLNYHQGGKLVGHDFHSEDMKARIKDNHFMNRPDYQPENHPMFGRKHSEESKALLSKAASGRVMSEEVKAKISESCAKNCSKGDNHYTKSGISDEHKANLKKARRNADINRIKEIFDLMIKAGHIPSAKKFNKINYELARSKLYARMYPKFELLHKFFSEDEVIKYFSDKSKDLSITRN